MSSFLIIILSYSIWIVYSLFEGLKNGSFFFYKTRCKRRNIINDCKIFTVQRTLVFLSTSLLLVYALGWISIFFIIPKIYLFKYLYIISYEYFLEKVEKENKKNIDIKIQDKKKKILILDEKE
jgi:hypothetical protein